MARARPSAPRNFCGSWAWTLLLVGGCAPLGPPPVGGDGLGARTLVAHDAPRQRDITFEVFYPAPGVRADEVATHTFIYDVAVARDAPLPTGRHPLVLLSHGTGGTRFDQAWLAAALVQRGYIVAAVRHPGDAFGDADWRTSLVVWNRPQDLSVALDTLLLDGEFGPRIDARRVFAAGHSVGGYAVAALAGSRYNIVEGLKRCFCVDDPSDWRPGPPAHCPSAQGDPTCEGVWPLDFHQIDYTFSANSYRDPRVRAVVAMAPAVGEAVDPVAAAQIQIPVLIFGAPRDRIAPYAGHAAHWHRLVPTSTLVPVAKADHYTFVTRCHALGPWLTEVCRDSNGIDRAAAQAQMAEQIARFFARASPASP